MNRTLSRDFHPLMPRGSLSNAVEYFLGRTLTGAKITEILYTFSELQCFHRLLVTICFHNYSVKQNYRLPVTGNTRMKLVSFPVTLLQYRRADFETLKV